MSCRYWSRGLIVSGSVASAMLARAGRFGAGVCSRLLPARAATGAEDGGAG